MIVSLEETFRPSFGRAMGGALIGFCAFAALAVVPEGWRAVFNVWPWLGLVGVASWTSYWNPRVVVTDGGIEVVNPFRTFALPWSAIVDIDTKWALTIQTSYGTIRAWAAPSPGRQTLRGQGALGRQLASPPKHSTARPSDLTITESAAAAQIVRQRWLRLIEEGHIHPAKDGAVTDMWGRSEDWHVRVVALLIALCALAAFSLAL